MKFLVLLLFLLQTIQANQLSQCEDALFSFNIAGSSSNVTVMDIVDNLSEKCAFSVKIKDKEAKKILHKNLEYVHISDYTLEYMFDFLLSQNNLFYRYNEKREVLTISYLETRTFVVDYVNLSEQTTESVKTITVGSDSGGSNQDNNSNGSSSSSSYSSGSSGSQQGQSGTGNTDNTIITSKSEFKFWNKLSEEIDTILSRDGDIRRIESKSIVNRTAGIITITGTKDQIERISNYLDKVTDRIHKQVILETQLFELTYANSQSTGIDWSKLDFQISGEMGKSWGGVALPNQYSYKLSMDGVLDFLNRYGKVHTLSTPKILTLNNQPAVINVGKQINYRYQSGSLSTVTTGQSTSNVYIMSSVFIGLTLNIIPEITDDGYVILRINPVVSEIDDDSDSAAVVDEQGVRIMPPDIKIKQLSSIVKAKDGNRVIIGGLVSESTKNRDTDVSLLGEIPLFGNLFKSKTEAKYRSELIVVITPRIIKNNSFPSIERVEKLLNGELNE